LFDANLVLTGQIDNADPYILLPPDFGVERDVVGFWLNEKALEHVVEDQIEA